MKLQRPMLAAAASKSDLEKLRYPLLASPKLDGIRCIVHPELGPVSRAFKPIPNRYIRESLDERIYKGLDGEIICFNSLIMQEAHKPLPFNEIQSSVMSHGGEPIFELWTFDWTIIAGVFTRRNMVMHDSFDKVSKLIKPLGQKIMYNAEGVQRFMSKCLTEGHEGLVLRDPEGIYKWGRSTLKQQGMIKYKEFSDAEGTIIGFEELIHNKNPEEADNFGLTKHSDKKEGMVPGDTLGSLILRTVWGELRVGTGFDQSARKEIWENRHIYIDKTVTFKYQTFGMQDLPRFPVFLRFREIE